MCPLDDPPPRRPHRPRRAWTLGLLIGLLASIVCAAITEVNAGPVVVVGVGLALGVLASVLLEVVFWAAERNMRTMRAGSPRDKGVALAWPLSSLHSKAVTAAIAVDLGEVARAETLMAGLPQIERSFPLTLLVQARIDLARGDAQALARLVEWPLGVARLASGELVRYHAYLLARCALRTPGGDAIAARLLAYRDPEVRGYGTRPEERRPRPRSRLG